MSYFSELDTPADLQATRAHLEQDQRRTPKPSDPQYQSRRRSRSVFLPQSLPAPPDISKQPTPPPKPSPPKAKQYTYEERQSHGYVFNDFSDSELLVSSPRTRNRHPTPPMTPDDTLSDSSVSPRERSRSVSPRSLFRDLGRTGPNPVVVEEDDDEHLPSDAHPANNRASSLPMPPQAQAAAAYKRDSASLVRPLSLSRARSYTSGEEEADPEPVDNRVSLDDLEVQNGGWRSRKSSLAREFSRRTRRSHSSPELLTRGLFFQGQYPTTSPIEADEDLNRGVSTSVDTDHHAAAESSRMTRLVAPRAKKSLSHVNLGLKGLPNGSMMGITTPPTTNMSMASIDYVHEHSPPPLPPVALMAAPVRPPAPKTTMPMEAIDSPLPALPASETYEETPTISEPTLELDSEEDLAAYAAYTTFIQSLTPTRPHPEEESDVSSVNSEQFPILSHESTSSPQAVAPLIPSPERSPSPLPPPRPASPIRYLNPLKHLTESPVTPPQPLPLAPPSPIEAPTPLPMPTPAPPTYASHAFIPRNRDFVPSSSHSTLRDSSATTTYKII